MATQRSRKSTSIPYRSATVRIVLASTLLAPLGVPLVSPALPAIRDAFALTDARASLLISTYFVTGIVLSPLIGLLADRVGRRTVLVPSLFVFSLTGAPLAVAPTFEWVLAIRIVQGTAAAGIFIVTVTLIGDAFEGVQRNAVLGANTAVLSAGAAVYPIVGGALAGLAWNAPFLAYLVGLPVALYAYWVLEEPTRDRETRSLSYLRHVARALSAREATVLYGSAFLIELLLFGAVFTALPFLLEAAYGLSAVQIGLVVTASSVSATVAAYENGRLAGYLSDYGIIAAGFLSSGVGLVVAWLARSPMVIGLATIVFGTGWGLALPSIDSAVSELVAARYRAGALSLRNSTTFLGRTVGPVLFAGIAVRTGYRPLLLAAGVVSLLAAASLAAAGRRSSVSRR